MIQILHTLYVNSFWWIRFFSFHVLAFFISRMSAFSCWYFPWLPFSRYLFRLFHWFWFVFFSHNSVNLWRSLSLHFGAFSLFLSWFIYLLHVDNEDVFLLIFPDFYPDFFLFFQFCWFFQFFMIFSWPFPVFLFFPVFFANFSSCFPIFSWFPVYFLIFSCFADFFLFSIPC